MRSLRCCQAVFAVFTALCLALTCLPPVQAADPNPLPDFTYGAILNLQAPDSADGLRLASSLGLDWVALPFSWAQAYPTRKARPDWSALDAAVVYAGRHQIRVLISITTPPAWALTPTGPDPKQTARLVAALLKRYPRLQAVELFPAANTSAGWGAPPDPSAYLALLKAVKAALPQKSNLLLPAGGLQPVDPAGKGRSDLAFLQELYAGGLKNITPIVSLRLSGVPGDPLDSPEENQRVLRHYEQIRQVMRENSNESGTIWITSLSPYSDTIGFASEHVDRTAEAGWLLQAFTQIQTQLYIGAVFVDGLNKAASQSDTSLLLNESDYHPFTWQLRALIRQDRGITLAVTNGKQKPAKILKKFR